MNETTDSPGVPGVQPGPRHQPSRADRRRAERARANSPLAWLREIAFIVVAALVVSSVLRAFIVQVFWIPSASMRDTLHEQDRIAVSRIAAWTGDIQRGDVVVFDDELGWLPATAEEATWWRKLGEFSGLMPAGSEQTLVKRVIGVGGDRITCCTAQGQLTVNGVAVEEPYLATAGPASSMSFDVTVPEGHLWVMGDNRDNSADSRYHMDPESPFVAEEAVVGRAVAIIWPLDRWATLPGREYFSQVSEDTGGN